MINGLTKHVLHAELCSRDALSIVVVAIDDQPWFPLESLPHHDQPGTQHPQRDRSQMDVKWPDGKKRSTSLLNELGLYRVLLTSENPAAADLARWVFEEVVPAVRKAGRFRMFQEAQRLGVHLDYTPDQWEWLKLHPYLTDVIPLALAGFDSVQITQTLGYNTPSGITVRKQITKLQQLGFLPARIVPRVKQLEARIAAQSRK